MIKSGLCALTGYVNGVWNKETKSFEVNRGVAKSGNKYQIFEIKVSTKNQDGTYTNGKGIKVMLWGERKVDANTIVGLVGRFEPDNYTNKEGKEVYGLMFKSNAEDMFEPLPWDKKEEPKQTIKEEEVPW